MDTLEFEEHIAATTTKWLPWDRTNHKKLVDSTNCYEVPVVEAVSIDGGSCFQTGASWSHKAVASWTFLKHLLLHERKENQD